jgi:hypothetical protein
VKERRVLSTIIALIIGVFIGFATSLLIGAIGSYLHPCTRLTGWPKTFGDIKVWAQDVSEIKKNTDDVSKVMLMAKADIPFLSVDMDRTGNVVSLSLLGRRETLNFTMTASDEVGKWGRAIYAGSSSGYTTGEMYVDINFDGHFDVKRIFDDTGKEISMYIYIDRTWTPVDRCNLQEAVLGQKKYVFDNNSGWQVKE